MAFQSAPIKKKEFSLAVLLSMTEMSFEAVAGGVRDSTEAMGQVIIIQGT